MRAINFSPGPTGLPLPALELAQKELLDFEGSGMSIMEQSHRGSIYEAVHNETISLLKELLSIPPTHTVLFVQGGATMQFAMAAMNFLKTGTSADYVLTSDFSDRAFAEAKTVGTARAAYDAKGSDKRYLRVPSPGEIQWDAKAAYAHTTTNNTIEGTQFNPPLAPDAPHICDMSSDFLSRPVDVSKFSLIYAGAQKNIGPSGIVVVIASKEFIAQGRTDIPKVLRYQTYEENNSLYNTPPTFSIYLCRNVLRWLKAEGGVSAIEKRNREKAELLYGALERMSDFYVAPVERSSRSVMNIVFRLPSAALDAKFVEEAKRARMIGLKGHRIAGGIRVSAYNAVTLSEIKTLVSFMESFAKTNR